MLGECVRPAHEALPQWVAVGAPVFRPLVARVQHCATGGLIDPAEVATWPDGPAAMGETILEAAVNTFNALRPAAAAGQGAALLAASSCGVGGRTLEALSAGAVPELFHRLRGCVALARRAAGDLGLGYGVLAVVFVQGEHNSWELDGGTAERAEYAALLRQFYRDVCRDVVQGVAGQAEPPAMFICQTGGAYASDDNAVAQAQLDVALDTPGCFLAGPTYPVTAKAGHLDANGYRWLGAQVGKVMDRVLTRGEAARPPHPIRAVWRDGAVEIAFHVPVAPLCWGRPNLDQAAWEPPDMGFSVVDADGDVPLTTVTLKDATTVRLVTGRAPDAGARVLYASKRHRGRGCLHDSDRTLAPDAYIYERHAGHQPGAERSDLIDRPYPLMNWCPAFSIGLATGV